MASRVTTFSDGNTLTGPQLENEFNEIFTNITNTNIASGAAIAISKTTLGTFTDWTSHSVAWTAVSVNPSIGNGSLLGQYMQVGKLVVYGVSVGWGSSTTNGTGAWRFDLPVTADSSYEQVFAGAAFANDTGTAFRVGAAIFNSATQLIVSHHGDTAGGWGGTVPHTWANGDTLRFSIAYQAL
jgi:hypothetical protein